METETRQSGAEEPTEPIPPTDAVREAFSKVGDLSAHARQFFGAKIDLAKVKARNLVLLAVLGVVLLFAAMASLVILLTMLFTGLAQAISAACGGRVWAGNLIVGGGIIALVGLAAFLAISRLKKSWLKATIAKYESRQTKL